MLIAGFNKTSFVDYPKKMCAVVFTPACNFDCWYCHNRFILKTQGLHLIPEYEVFEHLARRKDMLEAVTVSGGEPTLQKDLPRFIAEVKEMGFAVKLDTNGSNPAVLRGLLEKGLLDFIAMDIKAPFAKLESVVCAPVSEENYRESIALLLENRVDYEFRTTVLPQFTQEDILAICAEIAGAKSYWLQPYRPVQNEIPLAQKPHPPAALHEFAVAAKSILGVCGVRGA